MAAGFAKAGNQLYTGERAYPFIQKSNLWFLLAALVVLVSVAIPFVRGGFNLGIEFTGGSQFTISQTEETDIAVGEDAVAEVSGQDATVTNIAANTVRVQTEELTDDETLEVAEALQEGYGVSADQVTSTFIGPTWGEQVSEQMMLGLVIFIILVALYMALYFRTWKMSLAAILGLGFVVITTAGIYSATNFEVTPSAIIGFLTILSYALYDTMVVFDKIRENVQPLRQQKDQTFTERVNLAVNQTLVRSINTSVVGILPVGSILFIGAWLLGAGTLRDISLALFVGVIVGTFATIFVQAPLYARMRRNDADIVAHTEEVLRLREERGVLSVTLSGTALDEHGRPTPFPPLPEPEPEEVEVDEEAFEIVITGMEPDGDASAGDDVRR
ncbi:MULTISPECIES: protein translocase subunit SecF [unclassified Nesterenkonia]|uniref:protein translocase subunit SecF n=1 Tax=unclassified Nesterenkonia TaxID=2629769 RepID=UPI00087336E2|nr:MULTISPECIES: protein translocase subunit SecF [unclassified Nesterenkonia]MDS2171922.1 protein translocase subunit SecF [Nesterenkonia sp. CL21]OSM44807.1 protein translocase subunit SecF [Nesterenkonia sp. PF2B19]